MHRCMCAGTCTYVHSYVQACADAFRSMSIHACMHMSAHSACVQVYTVYAHMCVQVCACVWLHTHACMCRCMHMCACSDTCICGWVCAGVYTCAGICRYVKLPVWLHMFVSGQRCIHSGIFRHMQVCSSTCIYVHVCRNACMLEV